MRIPVFKPLLYLVLFTFLLTASPSVYAQKGNPGGNGNGGNPHAPIDGGISLLLASGAALGLYSLKKKK